MRTVGRVFILALMILAFLTTLSVQAYAFKKADNGELSVSIIEIQVVDLDNDGAEDDLVLTGETSLTLCDPPKNGKVIILVTLHLIHESGSTRVIPKILIANLNDKGEARVSFAFTVFNLKAGFYEVYLRAFCRGLFAESEHETFDPRGGTVGPL
ncbi:TPA: hypothetical protein EYP70_05440 [Candidatus Bathyarchaeota archaeon]|nr:hypothetical protein [Candidatus Bathyarchaeota archaeon]